MAKLIARLILAVTLVLSGLSAASPAFASKLEGDRIAGVTLGSEMIASSKYPDISARSGEIVTADGTMLWTRRAATRRAMASTTKVMTALLTLENCDLDETVTVTDAASHVGYALGLRTGETRSVRKMLELTLVASSNDAATALAIHVGGSRRAFAGMMNTRAAELGLTNTHYVNAHGLDAEGHFTSATDLANLMKQAMTHREFRRIVALESVYVPSYGSRAARRVASTDKLLGVVTGLRGGKTGFTDDADYCFVADARRDGVTLTSVVLGSASSAQRFDSSKRLLEWGFKHYRVRELCAAKQSAAGSVAIAGAPKVRVAALCAETVSAPVFDLLGPITREPSLEPSIGIPVFAGQRLGIVRLVQDDTVLATVPAIAAAPVASIGEAVGEVRISGYEGRTVIAKAGVTSAAVASYDTARPVERIVSLMPEVPAPIGEGWRLGTITYRQDGRTLVTVPAVAAYSVVSPALFTAPASAPSTMQPSGSSRP